MSDAINNAAIALGHAIASHIQMQLGAGATNSTPTPTTPQTETTPTPTPAPTPTDPFAGLGATPTQAPAEVTPKMIQELIIPLIGDAAKKAKLAAAMQELGIAELPAAKPEQLPALYAKFKAIADEGAGTPTPSAGTTII